MLWDFTKCSICSGLRSTRVVLQLACRGDEVRPDLWSKKQKKKEYFLKKAHPSHSSQLSSSPPCRALPHLLRGYSKTARKQVLAKKLHQVGQTLKKLHKRRTRTGRALHAAEESRATANIRNHTSAD